MTAIGRLFGAAIAALALVVTAMGGPARAHPHVWIIAKAELVYDASGMAVGVRHAWSFDEMFSTFTVQGLTPKQKGVYTREDLADLAQTNIEAMKEFGYFTFSKADGKKQKYADPKDYYLEYKDSVLTLHFLLPFAAPIAAKELALEVYDPTFFVDFGLPDAGAVKLVGAPANCAVNLVKPVETKNPTQKPMSEENFLNNDVSGYAAALASKVVVKCP